MCELYTMCTGPHVGPACVGCEGCGVMCESGPWCAAVAACTPLHAPHCLHTAAWILLPALYCPHPTACTPLPAPYCLHTAARTLLPAHRCPHPDITPYWSKCNIKHFAREEAKCSLKVAQQITVLAVRWLTKSFGRLSINLDRFDQIQNSLS